MHLARLFRTASFRLATLYAVLFGGSVLLLGALVFLSIRAELQNQVGRRIESEVRLLQGDFDKNGLEALIATVKERSRSAANLDYFLADATGKRLAGDLTVVPGGPGWVEIESGKENAAENQAESERVRALIVDLGRGVKLGVGEDVEQAREIQDVFLTALASTLGTVLVLGIGGGLLLGAAFLRRVDAITRTAEAIIAGDLSRRIERTGSGDDFDRLSATLNAMLDRIAGLMENLKQVSNDVAHDLRTPLSRLRQGLEQAESRELTATEYKAVVERARAEADSLLGTFSALLRIAQVEAGMRRSAFCQVDLGEIMGAVADAYGPVVEESGRLFRSNFARVSDIPGDRELLVQLFANLVENAMRHTPLGCCVTMSLRNEPSGVIAEVSDDGPGIPGSERRRVLRRFYRLEHSRTTPGDGLGLSLVAAIADLHQASMEMTDNAPGLRMQIVFPYGTEARSS